MTLDELIDELIPLSELHGTSPKILMEVAGEYKYCEGVSTYTNTDGELSIILSDFPDKPKELLVDEKATARLAALEGKQWQPRDIANECYEAGWVNLKNLTIAVAVCLAESQGFDRAFHDNVKALPDLKDSQIVCNVETLEHFTCVDPVAGKMRDSNGNVADYPLTTEWITSRDVGAFEINIPASQIGTVVEETLYDFKENVRHARDSWLTWSNGGSNPEQGWNHWAAFKHPTLGNVALNPESAGHYIHRACRGVGNFLADQMFHIPAPPLLYYKGGAVRL